MQLHMIGLNDPSIKLATAFPDQEKISSGKGLTLLGDIVGEGDERKRAFIKVLSIENIAKEAICSVLARHLHLPVQQAFYVSMINTEYSGQGNVEDVAFGMLNDRMPSLRLTNTQGIEDKLLKWPDLLRAAVFDEWIANRDRIPNNMVYERSDLFWLYDHDDAFPSYVRPATPVNPQLLAIAAKGKTEFELFKIRDDAMRIVGDYKLIDWDQIYIYLNISTIPSARFFFDKYVSFLKERLLEFRNILTLDLQIKQSELFLNTRNKFNTEIK